MVLVFSSGVNRWQQLFKQTLSSSIKLPKGNKVKKVSPGTDTDIIAVDIGPNTAHSFPGRFSGQAGPGAAERSIQRLGGELVLQSGAWHHYISDRC